VPSVLKVIKRANDHKIPYGLMEILNYTDLQSMIIDYDIDVLEQLKRDKERQRLDGMGIDRRKATADDWNKL